MEALQDRVDVVCVGETMLLLVPDPPRPPERAETFRREIGGAESDVAIHLARRGHTAAWVSALGDDVFGGYVRQRIAAENVDCESVRMVPGRRTGLYVKELRPTGTTVTYYRDGSAACTLTPADIERVWRRRPRLVHTTGITAALTPASGDLVSVLFDEAPPGTLRSFDINYRPAMHGPASGDMLLDIARRADVVFCGADEAQALWGVADVEAVAELFDGPDCVVVKQGPDGATAFRGGRVWRQPAPTVPVLEPVGAGDAFAAGVIDGMLDAHLEADLGECLRRGAELAGKVLQIDDDYPPRLTPDDVVSSSIRLPAVPAGDYRQ